MMDGGIADSVPIRKAIADGFDYNIVILTRGKGYYKKESNSSAAKLARLHYRQVSETRAGACDAQSRIQRQMDLIERRNSRDGYL